jgi:hypothetical protein
MDSLVSLDVELSAIYFAMLLAPLSDTGKCFARIDKKSNKIHTNYIHERSIY